MSWQFGRRACLVGALGLVMCGGRVAHGQPPVEEAKQLKPIWQTPAEIIYELEDVLAQGLIPITRTAPAAAGQPQVKLLELIDLDNGNARWTLPLASDIAAMSATGERLIVALHDTLAAVSMADGSILWSRRVQGRLDGGGDLTPIFRQIRWFGNRWAQSQGVGGVFLILEDSIFIKIGDVVYCVDPATGNARWQAPVGFSLSAPLVGCGGLVVAPIAFQGVTAVSRATGRPAWRIPIPKIGRVYSVGELIYCAAEDELGQIDPQTGKAKWSAKVGGASWQFLSLIEDELVVRQPDKVSVLDIGTGKIVWRTATAADCSAVGEDSVFFCTQDGKEAACFSPGDGKVRWQVQGRWERAPQALVAAKGTLVAVFHDSVRALDAGDGSELWAWQAPTRGGFIDSNTVVADEDTVYFHAASYLVGADLRSGELKLALPGNFFFVNWMRRQKDAICLHYQDAKVLQGLKVEVRELE